ncbi:MAG: PEP-CTERM sorting domain-containing protein [Desulfarculaceae bacterium]|nr:PEP-CTERM sorting domain-containing protein [Desulfarculaceae bacterium]
MRLLGKHTLWLALALALLAWPGSASADLFTIDRYSDSTVLVSQTFYSMPDVNALNWDDAAYANEVSHGGWGDIPGAEWISELSGANGPAASYRVFHLEISLPANAQLLTGRLDYMVDDYLWFYVNQDLAAENTVYGNWNTMGSIDFSSSLAAGMSSVVLDLVVKNSGSKGSNPLGVTFHAALGGETTPGGGGAATPEPATLLLVGSCLAGLAGGRWRMRRQRRKA